MNKFPRKTFHTICFFSILAIPIVVLAEEQKNQESFYKNVNANIEIRLVIESDDKNTSWLYMQDLEGVSHKVSKEILIDSSDIEGASVKKEFDEDRFSIYFCPTSWEKVYEATKRAKGKRVALVKDGEILTAPVVFELFFRAAEIATGSLATSEKFLKGFILDTRPTYLDSKELYHEFLSDLLSIEPDNLELMEALAYSYLLDEEAPQFDKALPHLETLAKANPKDYSIHTSLINCYMNLGKLDVLC